MQIITIEDKAFKFELVEGKPMVSSLDVASNFEKHHKVVIKAIEDDLVYDEFLNGHKIMPVEYKDKKGEMRKAYLLDRDAFAYFVMGFTGEKAKRWKLNYIKAFNQMEEALRQKTQPPANNNPSPMEVLENFFKVAKDHETRLETLEKTKRLEGWQEKRIKDAVDDKVLSLCDGDLTKRAVLYRKVWKLLKDRFRVPRYGEIPSVEFQEALTFIQKIRMIDLVEGVA